MDRAGLDKDSGSGNDKVSSSTTNAGDVHGRPASSEPTTSPKRSRIESHQDAASASATRTRRRSDNAQCQHIDKHAQHAQQQAPQPQAPKSIASTNSMQDANRRRQWSQTMLDVLQDLSLVLAPDGSIVWAPRTTKALLGFEPERLIGERFPDFIRPDEVAHFVHQFKESIDQQVDLYHSCHVRKADGEYKCIEMSGRPHYEEVMDPETGTQMHALRCFFLNARPHPSRAAQALDTFFDIKVENELLRQKLKQLGVMDEDLSEMGVPSEGLMRHTDPVDATHLPAGPQQRAQEVLAKMAGSRATHSSSGATAIEQSAAVPFDGNLAQTLDWQQQQQFYGPTPPPMLTRDSPAALDFLVNSFLRSDHLGPDVGSAGLSGQTPTQLPGSASYFYEIGAPSPDLGSMPLVASTSQAQSSAQAAQESQFLGYSPAVQQQQHVPPSQDFYPFQSPETYSVGLFGPPELPEPSTYLMQPSPSQRRDLLGMHQMQPQQQQHRPQQQSHPSNDSMPSQQTHQSQGSEQQQQKPNRVQDSPALHAARVLSNKGTLTFSDMHTTSPTTDQSHGFTSQSSVQMHKSGNAVHSPARTTKKLKKMRPDGDEYVCTDCGTTDSPEWRRGPRGAKTLCNACGLRFAKIQKKAGSDTLTHHPAQAQHQQQSHAGDYGHLPETRAAHTRRSSTSTAGD